MSGRVIVGDKWFKNSYVEDGKAIRVVSCVLCYDTGRQITDDGALGTRCDCVVGDALTDLRRCEAYCVDHQRSCNITGDHHMSHGQPIHECSYGQWGHDFFQQGATA